MTFRRSQWIIPRHSIQRLCLRSISTHPTKRPSQPQYVCSIDAEPLHRYRKGGYHPVALGDTLKDGRYKVLHKIGWGGYSTVWGTRDRKEGIYVAVKVSVAEDNRHMESRITRQLTSCSPSPSHTVRLLDVFELNGPNGLHECVVYELLGPNIQDTIDTHFHGRLPGKLAKSIAKQSLIGLDHIHQHGIGHGDLHTRNLVFALPDMNHVPEDKFIEMLGAPEIGLIHRKDGKSLDLEPGIPKYLVRSTSYQPRSWISTPSIKIIDFGESFTSTESPKTLHTPLSVRAPEVIFQDRIDYRVDLWSLGCMLFELFTGQPPFDSYFTTPNILVSQMRDMTSDDLPGRWHCMWNEMNAGASGNFEPGPNLQEWLEEVYFDGTLTPDLTAEDIVRLGQIIAKLLRFETSTRASARKVLDDPWFSE
ncbi:unnamed protein product [Penicillium salamii]|nr:unnamed protein product [Penicillium salamii]